MNDSILSIGDISILYYCFGLSFLIHWIIFIPSYLFKTEKFFDFTGMITYISLIVFALFFKNNMINSIDKESIILAVLISLWSIRLGFFLFYRILKSGEDKRFSEIKYSLPKFFSLWTFSAIWVCITCAPALVVMTSKISDKVDYTLIYIGMIVWLFGFLFEVIADFQKLLFRNKKENNQNFITTGLWSLSRHPNYFGEIVLWVGISMICASMLNGWQYVALISPIFVYILLNYISGINLLEKSADKKWGNLDSYKEYKQKTPELIPKFWN